jgi:hypothetical protein
MGEASKIALSAIGMQDTHLLSDNPEKSFFNPSYQQHSQFRKYHNVHRVIKNGNKTTWPFGETIKVTLNPQSMGDLLTNLWIHVDLPKWTSDITFTPGIGQQAELYIFGMTLQESGSASYNSTGVAYATYDLFWAAMIAAGDPGPGAPNAQFWMFIVMDYAYINYPQDFTWYEFRRYYEWRQFDIPGTDSQTLTDLYGTSLYFGAPPHLLVPAEMGSWGWDVQLLGRKIIKSVKFIVDDQVLEEITADWCIIYDNMYQTESQKYTANSAYNRNIVGASYGYERNAGNSESRNNLFIHIPFFFSQSYAGDVYSDNKQNKTPFPLCAIHKQKIMLEIDFFKQSFFTNNYPDYLGIGGDIGRGPAPPPPAKTMLDFNIITEEITLSNEESLFFKTNNREIIYDFVNKHSSMQLETNIGKRSFEIQLEPSIPVKCFHWFYRYKGYEDEDEYRHIETPHTRSFNRAFITSNRFNFTKAQYDAGNKISTSPHILKNAYFSLNGERFPNISNITYEYFYNYIPMQSKLSTSGNVVESRYPTPIGAYRFNYVYSYNFAMYPKSTMPSGFLDFSRLNSDKTKLHFELNDDLDLLHGGNGSSASPSRLVNPEYNFHLYYTGFRVLRFNNGFVSIT